MLMHAYGIDAHAHAAAAFEAAVAKAEAPAVPGADGAAVIVDPASRHRPACVRTFVVDHVGFTLVEEDRESVTADLDVLAFPLFQFRHLA
jgi:hypothetical protein